MVVLIVAIVYIKGNNEVTLFKLKKRKEVKNETAI